ncbi:DUF4003 domain-containing protein [Clostridium folliculivorans]|uniref:DUF4003 domain-containing protein n=1 Tax=Clostridium folliculivorans TaxID=2886038 RepID=A0A9W5XZ54_9CLOT|nr:DUF4003 domain-containing protein [Clostridium folliculivorans]GKU23600.1 hypothetical protein CFOLD11_04260 [Clostridium folliculivorans]GKU29716.1 hypothetical protein CFB3_18230 [Clostridium folliculivorans]
MDNIIKKNVDLMINNYIKSKNKLKYDGDLLNHFAALILTNSAKELNYEKIRAIRKFIKESTSWFSTFRGNNLYVISILLSLEEEWQKRFRRIQKWEEHLKDAGFVESPYLSIGIWILTENFKDEEMYTVSKKMREIFLLMKEEYYNVTSSDDYIICAILVTQGLSSHTYMDITNKAYDEITNHDFTTNNGAQTLATILCTNPSEWNNNLEKAIDICKLVKSSVGSIQPQYVGVIGVASTVIKDADSFIREVYSVEKYLNGLPDYQFFMDRGFRLMISMFMVILSKKKLKTNYLNSIMALIINYSLVSQQQAIISRAN